MASPETAKPAAAIAASELRNVEQLCGRLESQDTRSLSEIQAFRLNRRFGFAFDTAVVIAELAFVAGCSR
jgi:hypothetical protein